MHNTFKFKPKMFPSKKTHVVITRLKNTVFILRREAALQRSLPFIHVSTAYKSYHGGCTVSP